MNYIKSVKIKVDYPNTNTFLDITDYVILETVRLQDRDDLAFGRGGFKFKAPINLGLNKNIAPYSLCEFILHGDDGNEIVFHFVMSSIATYYITQNVWIHDCTLMSLDSVLETLIVGAKTISFSNNANDLVSLNKILTIVNNKYNSDIQINGTYLNNYSNDYSFPVGTTLFDVIKEYIQKNDITYTILLNGLTNNHIDAASSVFDLIIIFMSNTYDTLDIPTNLIEYEEYNQNTDNYCKYIETLATDVIDRDTLMKVKNLTPRSTNNVLVSADEAKLVLPTKVESIEKIELTAPINNRNIYITTTNNAFTTIKRKFTTPTLTHTTESGWEDVWEGSFKNFINSHFFFRFTVTGITSDTNYDCTYNIFYRMWQSLSEYNLTTINGDSVDSDSITLKVKVKFDNIDIQMYKVENGNNVPITINAGMFDFTDKLLEENVWNGLEVREQPKYLVYKSGTNVIYNMNGSYRQDFWGEITGMATGNFLEENRKVAFVDLIQPVGPPNYSDIGCMFYFKVNLSTNPLDYLYNVECYAFTNPYLIDAKNGVPNNEIHYKPMGRTYSMGDSNGFEIDFKSLTNDMDKQNEILGRSEHIVELNTTNISLVMSNNYRLPRAKDSVRLGGMGNEYWFVASLEHKFNKGHNTTQLNLAKKQTKVADAIGVDYQYNPTILPLNNIIDRPLFYELDSETLYDWLYENSWDDKNNDTFVVISFNGLLLSKRYAKRPVVQMTDTYAILYVEAMDNVVFDYAVGSEDTNLGIYPLDPNKYVDSSGQCDSVSVDIECINQRLSLSESKELPNANVLFAKIVATYTAASNEYIYKDQRERLTFTIKINKN